MNSEEVLSLLQSAVKYYLDPSSIRPSESLQDAALRQCANIRELFEELRRYVTSGCKGIPSVSQSNSLHTACLTLATTFVEKKHYREAIHACLSVYHESRDALDAHAAQQRARFEQGGKMAELLAADTTENAAAAAASSTTQRGGAAETVTMTAQDEFLAMRHRHDAAVLTSVCNFFLTLESDPAAEGEDTLRKLESYVADITSTIQKMLPQSESFYFVIFNATVFAFECCKDLMRIRHPMSAAPILAYCGRVMDGVLPLATVTFLPWRLRLFSAVALCYEQAQDFRAAHKVSMHALKITEDLYDLETSDVVPPSKAVVETLTQCLLDARCSVQQYQWKASSMDSVSTNLQSSVAAAAAASPQDTKKGAAAGKGASSNTAAGNAAAEGTVPLPQTAVELLDAIKNTIRGTEGFAALPPSTQLLRRTLDISASLAVDSLSRYMPLSATSLDANRTAAGSNPSEHDATMVAVLDPLKSLAAESIATTLAPMVEEFLRRNATVVTAYGWNAMQQTDGDGRPTTADGSIEGTTAVNASKKGGGAANKAAAKGADKKGGQQGGAQKSASPTHGVGADEERATPLDDWLVQANVEPEQICDWIKALFTANVDGSNVVTQKPLSLSSIPPTPFYKLVVSFLTIFTRVTTSTVGGSLYGGAMEPARINAAVAELNAVLAMSIARRSCANVKGNTAVRAVVDNARLNCVSLATAVKALQKDVLIPVMKQDLLEDAARMLLACWAQLPFSSELPDASLVYSTAVRCLIATSFPDVIMIGNTAITACRLLRAEGRNVEALLVARSTEEFLCTRQVEFVFNNNAWCTAYNDDPLAEVLRMDRAATLHNSLWLRTLRDIRTVLIQQLASLRLKIAAADQHEATLAEHRRKVDILRQREQLSHLFGELTRKERRVLQVMENVVYEPPTTAEKMERQLAAWAASDPLHSALVMIEVAKCQPNDQAKRDKLKKALEYLVAAQTSYDATFRALVNERNQEDPAAPLIRPPTASQDANSMQPSHLVTPRTQNTGAAIGSQSSPSSGASSKQPQATSSSLISPRGQARGATLPLDEITEATEVTHSKGLSIYLVWALFTEACSLVNAKDLSTGEAEKALFDRFVVRGNATAAPWNANPFAIDALHNLRCNTASPYLCAVLATALSVIADCHAEETPYIPDDRYVDDDELGLDKRRSKLRQVQSNYARCGNTALLALELAVAANDQPSMSRIAHQVFNCTLPLVIAKSQSIIVLRPLTILFHVFTLFEERRWSDGPLQFLAVRSLRAALDVARQLSPSAQRPVMQRIFESFQYVWPMVLSHPNLRQLLHMDTVIAHIRYVDRVFSSKLKKPADAAVADAAAATGKGAKGAAKAPAGKPSPASASGGDSGSSALGGKTSLYYRTELFFDDLMPVEYLELLDEMLFRVTGGAALCEQMEAKYTQPPTGSSRGGGAASLIGGHPPIPPTPLEDANGVRRLAVQRESKTLFPPSLLQVATMLQAGVSPPLILSKLLETKSSDPFFSKVCTQLAMELISRRQDEFAAQAATEAIKEIVSRHEILGQMQAESARQLKEFLQAIGHYSAVSGNAANESAAQAQSMFDRLLQKISRRVSELRRRMVFQRLRTWFMQYDLPFQALANLVLAVLAQREAEKEKLRVHAQQSTGTTPASGGGIGAAAALPPAPKGKASSSSSAGGVAGVLTPKGDLAAMLAGGMNPEERLSQLRDDVAKRSVRALVLFNRCYRTNYSYVTAQFFINALRTSLAAEPPSVLTDVLQQARQAEQGGLVSTRSANSNATSGGGGGGASQFHITIAQTMTKAITDGLGRLENYCKVFSSEIIKLLRIFDDGLADNAVEIEFLQPVAVKVGEDCLPSHSIIRRSTALQMWLSAQGLFEDQRHVVYQEEKIAVRQKIFLREQNELEEMENWERLQILKDWAKGLLETVKGFPLPAAAAKSENEMFDDLMADLRSNISSSRQSQTTDNVTQSTRVDTAGGMGGFMPVTVRRSGGKSTKSSKTVKIRVETSQGGKGKTAGEADDAAVDDDAYKLIAFEPRLGTQMPLSEIVRCFFFAVRCMQYGQKKQSAVAMALEMNEVTNNHYATTLIPYVLNLQNAMGQNMDKAMGLYMQGHRETVRTKKLIQEAHRLLAVYKDTDGYRRAQQKLASSLQPSRRGVISQTDADVVSVGTSAHSAGGGGGTTSGGHGGVAAGSSMYKEVVAAFTGAISYLRQKHSTLLLVGVLFELGHLHLTHRVKTEAERCWNDVVDAAFSAVNTLKNWRSVLESFHDDDIALLEKLGVHRAVLSAAALSSLAMFIYQENQKKATEACLLAAQILRALVTAGNLAAPQRSWDHSGSAVREVFVNVDLSAMYSEFMPTIVQGLLYASHHLYNASYPQPAIFVANVVEFLSMEYARARECTVYARLLKAQASAACTDFSHALSSLEDVALARRLPDASSGCFGQTVDIADAKSQASAAAGSGDGPAGGKKAADPKKKNDVPAVADGASDGSGGVLNGFATAAAATYDNSKPPSHPHNFKAIEAFLNTCFPNMAAASGGGCPVALLDVVSGEYGPLLTRQVLASFANVLLSLCSSDVLQAWTANVDADASGAGAAAQGGKGGKEAKKDPKGAAAAVASSSPSTDGSMLFSLAFSVLDKLIAVLAQCRVASSQPSAAIPSAAGAKGAAGGGKADAAQAAAAAAAALLLPPVAIGSQVTPVEELYLRHQCMLLQAKAATLRGNATLAVETLRALLSALNTEESYTLSVASVPSFTMSTTGRYLSDVYTLLGKNFLWLRRWAAAVDAASNGIVVAEQCGDAFAQRELVSIRVVAQLREGNSDAAVDALDQLCQLTGSLECSGLDNLHANASVLQRLVHVATVEDPRLISLSVLTPTYDASANKHARDVLNAAMQLLRKRAQDLGLNVAVDSHRYPCNINAQTAATYELHRVVNILGALFVRCGQLDDAIQTFRFGLELMHQYDTTRFPHESTLSRLYLGVALRQKHLGASPKLRIAPLTSSSSSLERPQTSTILQSDAELRTFFSNALPGSDSSNRREMVEVLMDALDGNIRSGLHDYEVLRQVLCNLALITASCETSQLHYVTVNLIALAAVTSTMQNQLSHNTSMFSAAAPTVENPTAALNVATELPAAIVAIVEEFAKRDAANQQAFLNNAAELQQFYVSASSSAAAVAATTGKGGANGAAVASSGAAAASLAVNVTLPHVITMFLTLHRERSSAHWQHLVLIDSLLLKLRQFLQTKTVPFSLAAAMACDSSSPYIFNTTPRAVMHPVIAFQSPVQFPRANFVFSQCFIANTSSLSKDEVEGEEVIVHPHVTLLLTVSAVSDPESLFPAAEATTVGAAGGKGKAPAPPPATKGQPAVAAGAAAATNSEDASATGGGAAVPVVLVLPHISQLTWSTLHRKAKAIVRQYKLLEDSQLQLDEALSDAANGGGSGAAPPAKGGAAAAAPSNNKGGAAASAASPIDTGLITGMTPRFAPLQTGPDDHEKGEVLLSFIELLVAAACGDNVPPTLDAFFPTGSVTVDHMNFIAGLTNVNGGVALTTQCDVHRWVLRMVTEIRSIVERN